MCCLCGKVNGRGNFKAQHFLVVIEDIQHDVFIPIQCLTRQENITA
jgi:hypothetical protein